MNVSGLDGVLWIMGSAGELLLLVILLYRGLYKVFPLFTAFILWALISDPLLFIALMARHDAFSQLYYRTYFAINILQYALEIGVLVEIGANVLRPSRNSRTRGILFVLWGCMLVIGLAAFLFAAHLNASTLSHTRAFFVMDTTVAILRLVTFVLIAGFSQVLGLGWRNHVLQLASGLAFYATVTLIVGVAHSYLRATPDYAAKYREFAQLGVLGYLCALYYWCYSFARQEAPRKEFSPQMAQLLVSIAGSTKRQRSVLARSREK
jgi:hypothetical protein